MPISVLIPRFSFLPLRLTCGRGKLGTRSLPGAPGLHWSLCGDPEVAQSALNGLHSPQVAAAPKDGRVARLLRASLCFFD